MGRMILGVVVGYIIMAGLIFAGLSAAYLAMGADRVFAPGSYEVSALWLVTNITISALAAFVGCFAAGMIARRSKAALVLCGIMLVLGLGMAVGQMVASKPDPGPRTGDVPNLEAMMKARQPTWYMFAIPIVGGATAVVAASVLRKRLGA